MDEAIKCGGTTIRSYTSSLGVTGRFQQSLRCHTMKTCPICGGDIKKVKLKGRGTYYCPNCQNEDSYYRYYWFRKEHCGLLFKE